MCNRTDFDQGTVKVSTWESAAHAHTHAMTSSFAPCEWNKSLRAKPFSEKSGSTLTTDLSLTSVSRRSLEETTVRRYTHNRGVPQASVFLCMEWTIFPLRRKWLGKNVLYNSAWHRRRTRDKKTSSDMNLCFSSAWVDFTDHRNRLLRKPETARQNCHLDKMPYITSHARQLLIPRSTSATPLTRHPWAFHFVLALMFPDILVIGMLPSSSITGQVVHITCNRCKL